MKKSSSQAVVDYRRRIKIALVQSCGGRCGICNLVFPTYIFEFHHINPKDKKFSLSGGPTIGKDKIANEAKKCIMVCANCHRLIEYSGTAYSLTSNFDEEIFYKTINELNGTTKRLNEKKRAEIKKSLKDANKPLRPSREELKFLIRNYPFLQIGKKYGVSDNAIRKWCIKYHLPSKVSQISLISDKDWEHI